MRVGISIDRWDGQPATVGEMVGLAQRAEAAGFASGWLSNIFALDALTTIAVCGAQTARIELGTAVVPIYTRHPWALAQQALTTQAASGGRLALGIGLSHAAVVEGVWGLSYAQPLQAMADYLAVLTPLVQTGQAQVVAGSYRVNATLTVPGATPCPILLAALGPQMLALAGRVAAGTITWMTGPQTLRDHIIPTLGAAAAAAGRSAPRVVAGLPVAVTDDPAAARALAARAFRIYGVLPAYRAMLDREGAAGPGDIAVVGDEDTVAAALARLAEIGVTDFQAVPFAVGPDKAASVERTYTLLARLARAYGAAAPA